MIEEFGNEEEIMGAAMLEGRRHDEKIIMVVVGNKLDIVFSRERCS